MSDCEKKREKESRKSKRGRIEVRERGERKSENDTPRETL